MCGIAGFVGSASTDTIERMCARIAHRGPDGEGLLEKDGVSLGHRRLSIIDLEGGSQPMETRDASLAVVFNGEIYNHAELRLTLQGLGHQFVTDHSDTEVLLHGYRQWGEDLPTRLNGMWAFVIHDRTKGRLFASRDRFGKKPFYYAKTKGGLAFASELRALAEHPDVSREPDRMALAKLLAHNFIPAPLSALKNVAKLPGGHSLVHEIATATTRTSCWWEFDPDESGTFKDESVLEEELLKRLELAVTRRLISDVPLGVFLSGGIDSSLVVALAARHVPRLSTFSVGFTEPSFDESVYARTVASHFGTEHHEEILDLERARGLLPEIFARLDEPNGDASILPTFLLSQFTRKHVTVALGGDGGDELFAGYDPFKALSPALLYSRVVPRPLHSLFRSLAGLIPVSDRNVSFDFKIKRTLRGLSHPESRWLPVWMGPLDHPQIEKLLGIQIDPEELYSETIALWRRFADSNPITKASHFFTRLYMQESVLAKVDRATMMNGLEARAPFLDADFASFAGTIPAHFKFRKGTTKSILKQAALKLLPEEIVFRRKKGFGMPISRWTRGEDFRPVGGGGELYDPILAKGLWNEHRAGKANNAMCLWTLRVFDEWKDRLRK